MFLEFILHFFVSCADKFVYRSGVYNGPGNQGPVHRAGSFINLRYLYPSKVFAVFDLHAFNVSILFNIFCESKKELYPLLTKTQLIITHNCLQKVEFGNMHLEVYLI